MKFSAVTALAAAGVFAATLGSASLASAQTDPQSTGGDTSGGTTSGPAAGTNVVPSTVTQKKRSHHSKHHKAVTTAPDSDGAPGTAAKQGSESGAPPAEPPK